MTQQLICCISNKRVLSPNCTAYELMALDAPQGKRFALGNAAARGAGAGNAGEIPPPSASSSGYYSSSQDQQGPKASPTNASLCLFIPGFCFHYWVSLIAFGV